MCSAFAFAWCFWICFFDVSYESGSGLQGIRTLQLIKMSRGECLAVLFDDFVCGLLGGCG